MDTIAKYRHVSAAKTLWPFIIFIMCFLFSAAIQFDQAAAADGRDELLRSVAKLSAMLESGVTLRDLQTIQVEIITNTKLATISKVTIPDDVRVLIVTMEKVRSVWEMTLVTPCDKITADKNNKIMANENNWNMCIKSISNDLSSIGASAPLWLPIDSPNVTDIVRNCIAALGRKTEQAVTALSN